MLVAELEEIGLADAALDENGYVTATLAATGAGPAATIGLIAHLDVSPDGRWTATGAWHGRDVRVWETDTGRPLCILPVGENTQALFLPDRRLLTVTFGDPATTPGAIKTLDDLNTKLSTVGLAATLDGQGNLSFSTTAQTASKNFSIAGSLSGGGAGSKFTSTTSTLPTRGGNGADARDSYVTQYNNLLDQLDTLAKDSSFNGINLLNGDTLSILFNEKNTSRLDIAGTSTTSSGLGLSDITASDFADANAIGGVLSKIERASTVLASEASRLGSTLAVAQTRQDFTKQLINTLTTGADNLVNADLNEEGANLLALQTKQSLSQTSLSLASQADQSVLKLFG